MADPRGFLIVGAGGIGAYYGARLLSAGHPVTLVARGDHLQVLQDRGLRVEHPTFRFAGPVQALSIDQLVARHSADEYRLVVLATKAGATAGLLHDLGAWLDPPDGPAVCSLQNGVDNEAQIAARLGLPRTIGGLAVRIGGHVTGPGCIEARGPAQVVFGAWPNARANPHPRAPLDEIADQFNAAGIPTQCSDDIRRELWKKLLINNGVNPLSALTELDTRALSTHPVFGSSVYRLMQEAASAARLDEVDIGNEDIDAMFELVRTFDPIKTSMLVDLEKGRELELDEIAGAVLARCRRGGVAAPVTELVQGLLQLKLAGRTQP